MPDKKPALYSDTAVVVVILVRVVVMLVIWLGVFLAIFFGYFTVPFILVSVITAIYLISDIGLFVSLRRKGSRESERQAFIESTKDDTSQTEK